MYFLCSIFITGDIHTVLSSSEFFSLLLVIGTFQSFEIVRKLDCPDPEIQTRYLIKFTVVSLKNIVPHFSKSLKFVTTGHTVRTQTSR